MVKTKNLGKSVLGQVKQFGGSKTCLGGPGMFRKDFEEILKFWNFYVCFFEGVGDRWGIPGGSISFLLVNFGGN